MLKLMLLLTFQFLANMSLKRTSKKIGAPKALYESTHIRIPVPVKEQVEEVSDWYRGLLRRGVKVEKLPIPLLSLSEIRSNKKAKLSIRKKGLKLIHGMN
jgi:hypothetical protein